MKFRKKPVVIDAVQFNPPKEFSNRFAAHGTFFSVHLDARGVHANAVIQRAAGEGTKLYKYCCPHCFGWHVTKQERHAQRE
jgi:hypothetical protein